MGEFSILSPRSLYRVVVVAADEPEGAAKRVEGYKKVINVTGMRMA